MVHNKIFLSFMFCAFILFVSNTAKAQNTTITGTVTNSESGEAVEFANIGIESTYLGTATDIDGEFEIILSQQIKDKTIRISAVGFKPKSYLVSEWLQKEAVIIQLSPVNYGLSEVNIEAKSKMGNGIIRSASNLITDNYLQVPYTYKCYLQCKLSAEGKQKVSESLFVLSDNEGYTDRSFTAVFKKRNYKIIENNTQDSVNSLKDGLVFIDQLINQDIVRCPGNILSIESINDFNIDVIGTDVIEGDSVWLMHYECSNPSIHTCGDPELVNYTGKIWINKKNNVVLKNSLQATRKGYFMHGNSFKNISNNQEKMIYKAETTYAKKGDMYVLNSVNYVVMDAQQNIQKQFFLKVVEVMLNEDKSIVNRQYYNDVAVDSLFWSKYKRPQM